MNGTYYWLPEFLGSRHPLESAPDVDAYFSRMSALARALDQETERIRHDAGIGVIPPSFVINENPRSDPHLATDAAGSYRDDRSGHRARQR